MKRLLLVSAIALTLILSLTLPALAAPPAGADNGAFAFGEFSSPGAFSIGAGLGLTEALSLGVDGQYAGGALRNYGGFVNLGLGRIAAAAHLTRDDSANYLAKASAVYRLDLFGIKAGIGGGVLSDFQNPITPFIEANLRVPAGRLALYGNIDYFPADGATQIAAGICYGF